MANEKELSTHEDGMEVAVELTEAATGAEALESANSKTSETGPADDEGGNLFPDETLLSSITEDNAEDEMEAQAPTDDGFAFTEDTASELDGTDVQDDLGIQFGEADEDESVVSDSVDLNHPSSAVASTESSDTPVKDEDNDEGAEAAGGPANAEDAAVRRTRRGRPRRTREPSALTSNQIVDSRRRRNAVQDYIQREEVRERRENRNDAWSDMQGAMSHGRILKGKVSGVRNVNNRVYAVVMFSEMYLVLIPFQNFYVEDPIRANAAGAASDADRANIMQRQTAMLEKHYGYETPFVVTRMEREDNDAYIILGSRAAALVRRAHENFTPGENGEAVMRPGEIVPAVVTSIAEHSIAVNVGGVDTRVRASDLTFRYAPSGEKILENYAVGMTIPVMLMGVKKTANGNWACQISRRRVEMEEAKVRHHLFNTPGDLTSGIVTGRYFNAKTGWSYLRLYLDAYDLPAVTTTIPKRPNGEYPAVGESYRVAYRGYNEETGVTMVQLRGYHGPARL